MTKAYIFMFIAIFFEVTGTLLLPSTQNFTKIIPTAIAATCYISALYCLTNVLDKIPIAIVYATWSGLGIFTIALFGYIFFKQTLAWQAILGLFLIVAGVVLVNTFASKVI
jgi:small multidrug resistance pump|tara:strand:+ start:711 stop:1043 length:333 start_codon:yes stop_codon:yes gene_type:complete